MIATSNPHFSPGQCRTQRNPGRENKKDAILRRSRYPLFLDISGSGNSPMLVFKLPRPKIRWKSFLPGASNTRTVPFFSNYGLPLKTIPPSWRAYKDKRAIISKKTIMIMRPKVTCLIILSFIAQFDFSSSFDLSSSFIRVIDFLSHHHTPTFSRSVITSHLKKTF